MIEKRKAEKSKLDRTKRKAPAAKRQAEGGRAEAGDGRVLVTSRGLAVALGVSLRTVERMLHDEEIKPVWVRGAQRFHVPDVVQQLVALGAARKNGREAALAGTQISSTQYPRRVE